LKQLDLFKTIIQNSQIVLYNKNFQINLIEEVIIHEEFEAFEVGHDICLLRMLSPFQFNE